MEELWSMLQTVSPIVLFVLLVLALIGPFYQQSQPD